jgi:hypothetical protein
MVMHRTALRLRGLIPVLLSQNNRQLNRPQSSWPTDFEGSLFNRLLRQGSGLHPQTGSPQNQWAFPFAQESWNRLAACSSGVLAVLFGSGQSPVTCRHYFQNLNQARDLGAGFSALVSWLIWPSKNVILSLLLAKSARSCFTSSSSLLMASVSLARVGSDAVSASSGRLITHWLPTFLPMSNPLVNLRLTVFGETPRTFDASFIESSIPKRVTQVSNPKLGLLTHSLPNLPMLSKCNHG